MEERIQQLLQLTANRIPVQVLSRYFDGYIIKIRLVEDRIRPLADNAQTYEQLFDKPPADEHRKVSHLLEDIVESLLPEYSQYKELVEYLRNAPADARQALAGLHPILERLQAAKSTLEKGGVKPGIKIKIQ